MFSRKSPETEDRAMSALPDDLGIPMKPARPAGQQASVAPLGRNPAPVPPRTPEAARQAGDTARPSEAPRRPPEAAGAPPRGAGGGGPSPGRGGPRVVRRHGGRPGPGGHTPQTKDGG